MCSNLFITYGNKIPLEALLCFNAREYYNLHSEILDSFSAAMDSSPDPFGQRKGQDKQPMPQAKVEERIAQAHNTRVQQQPLQSFTPGSSVEILKFLIERIKAVEWTSGTT